EPVREAQVGDVGGFAVGQRAVAWLGVGALDQADVDACRYEAFQVARCAAEVGLCRGPQPAGQAPVGGGLDAGEHGLGAAVVLGSDLDAPAGSQAGGDHGEAVRAAVRVDIQAKVGQVGRQPYPRREGVDLVGQAKIGGSDPVGGRRVVNGLAEQVNAAAHAPLVECPRCPDGRV